MLNTATTRSTARASRLKAAREYAAEVVQHVESQDNLSLEDKILGNLSGIVAEAIDCLRSDQPFRSTSLSMLSLELLSYLRQQNKPMVVNFACAFTMLMSELEGLDLSERGGEAGGGPRSYSNSIPDVPPETSTTTTSERGAAVPFSTQSTSSYLLPRPPPSADTPSGSTIVRTIGSLFGGMPKEENDFLACPEDEKKVSLESIEYDEFSNSGKLGRHSAGIAKGEEAEDGVSESSFIDDAGYSSSTRNELLQQMLANLSAPSTSSATRSEAARNQPKNKSGRFESRDDELAATYNLPVSAKEIETMPDQEMVRLLRTSGLSELQRSIMRQIRKRARSKISSREYRKRKEARRLETMTNSSAPEPASKEILLSS